MALVTLIKQDAVIDLKVGTGFLERLHKLVVMIVSEKTQSEVEIYKKLVDDGHQDNLPESWMETLYTVNSLIKALEEEAINSGQVYDKEETSS